MRQARAFFVPIISHPTFFCLRVEHANFISLLSTPPKFVLIVITLNAFIMAVSSERELESTPEAASVANTQDEELEHGTDIQLGHPSLTASGQISQQLLEEAFQKEESRKERQEAREEAREERQEARDEARKERQEARDEARKQELHLLNVEEHKARINQLAIAKSSQIPAAQDIPGGRRLAKRKRSESPSNEKGKLKRMPLPWPNTRVLDLMLMLSS